jgi:hypothetical protein
MEISLSWFKGVRMAKFLELFQLVKHVEVEDFDLIDKQ